MKAGYKVLDVCSGTGNQVLYYTTFGLDAYGIDLDQGMLEQAINNKKLRKTSANFVRADAKDIPFKDNHFDFVSISLGLHENSSEVRDRIISEMKRVVKSGGHLVFADFEVPLPNNWIGWIIRIIEWIASGNHYKHFREYLSQGGLDPLIKRHGLTILRQETMKNDCLKLVLVRLNSSKIQRQNHFL
jgi:ubiquinone/menaquinone biosynthesis C-methylase UbiE